MTMKEHLRIEIGKNVKKTRKELALTQAELAKELGISQSKLSNVERGEGELLASEYLIFLDAVA